MSRESPKSIGEFGFTLIEVIVSLFISSLILSAAFTTFSSITAVASDSKLRVVTQLEAQSALEIMTADLRMIGNGVPFHQANFLIGQLSLSDPTVTEPILVDGSTETQIRFRLNESGETYLLVQDFDPATDTTISLTGIAKIFVGDQIYITNSTVGLDDGLWATVSAVNEGSATITVAGGAQYHPGAVFPPGSLLEVVPIVTYASTADFGGITRDNGTGVLTLIPSGQFSLEYLNADGDAVGLPLIATPTDPFPPSAIQNVHAIRVTVMARSATPLRSGELYVATAQQSVGIRNLNFKY